MVVLWRCCGRAHDAPKRIGKHIVFSQITDQVLHLISHQKSWSTMKSLRSEGQDSLQIRSRVQLGIPGWAWCLSLSWSGKAWTELSRRLSMARSLKNQGQAIKNFSMAWRTSSSSFDAVGFCMSFVYSCFLTLQDLRSEDIIFIL